MRRASPHVSAALLVATGVLALASGASAQSAGGSAEARGLRYLSWPGRGEAPTPARAEPARPAPARTDLRRPNTVIPHGGFARTEAAPTSREASSPAPARRTLTPANAWLRPTAPAPEYAPAPAPTAVAPPPPPPPPPPRATPQPRSTPDYLPDQGPRGQPAPAEVVYASPAAADAGPAAAPADPMAPRRDAPIFHMQRDAPPPPTSPVAAAPAGEAAPEPRRTVEVAASGDGPPRQGARYYSVHRQNGRQPDALDMPAPNYVDALVVSSIDTIASQDLAAPAEGPTLIRDRDGNVRSAPAASDGDHQ
ncbi:MAG: hypothetical protein ACK4JY_05225 [Brevundimonas sp.]|uniref:hypothetical protein n=1 Tax=Brevundimonas sp. TaxID=1871086 RepID=UPI00391D2FAF